MTHRSPNVTFVDTVLKRTTLENSNGKGIVDVSAAEEEILEDQADNCHVLSRCQGCYFKEYFTDSKAVPAFKNIDTHTPSMSEISRSWTCNKSPHLKQNDDTLFSHF